MKLKKFLAVAVALGMSFSIAGCNVNDSTNTAAQTTISAEAADKTTAETAASNAETTAASAETTAAETTAEKQAVTVTDMIGREVEIVPGSYERVVCIGAGALRMYSYVGDMAILCGVEDIDNTSLAERPKMFDGVARPYVIAYSEVFNALPSCGVGGPNAQAAEAEKLIALSPDIIISEYEDVEKENALQEQLGVPVITLKSGAKAVFDDSFANSLLLLGQIFDKNDRAEELVDYIAAEKSEIMERTAMVVDADKPSVYICGLGNWGTTNHLMTAENYVSFGVANVKNVLEGLGIQGVGAIEAEKFVEIGENMDIMFIDAAAVKNIKPLYAEDPTMFDTCKAWQEGNVYLEMAYNAYYTNYEITLINTWYIAKCVYPDLFEDIDISAKTDEVTEMFLGRGLADEIFAYPASFGGYQKLDTQTFFAN